jgi:hypothetical protein
MALQAQQQVGLCMVQFRNIGLQKVFISKDLHGNSPACAWWCESMSVLYCSSGPTFKVSRKFLGDSCLGMMNSSSHMY